MKLKISHWFLIVLLFCGLIVRLYKIDNPIGDWHSWRQADTSAVTRNYIKYGIDLLHPRYDDFFDVSSKGLFNPKGYRFVEFPVFNLAHYALFNLGSLIPSAPYEFVHSLFEPILTSTQTPAPNRILYKIAEKIDFTAWVLFASKSLEYWGRLTTVLFSLVSAVLIFAIVRRHISSIVGLLAAFFYLFLPYNIYFTRVILPDPLMVTLFLAALNFHDLKRKFWTLIFGSLAILVKPVAVFFLLPIYLSNFWLGLIMLLPFGAWRLWSYRYPEGVPTSLWLLNGNKIRFKPSFYQWLFGTRLGILILGKWGIWPFLHGLINIVKPFSLWAFGALVYITVFATGNIQHDYYQTPVIPIVAILLAIGFHHVWNSKRRILLNRIVLLVATLFMFAFAWYDIRGLYQINNYSIVIAGKAVDQLTPKDSVVVAPFGGDTAFLYQTNRPGFAYLYMPIKDMIDRYSADYYVSVNYDEDTKKMMEKYTVVEQKPEYVIVKLIEPIRPLP